jgi:hypothetical protein
MLSFCFTRKICHKALLYFFKIGRTSYRHSLKMNFQLCPQQLEVSSVGYRRYMRQKCGSERLFLATDFQYNDNSLHMLKIGKYHFLKHGDFQVNYTHQKHKIRYIILQRQSGSTLLSNALSKVAKLRPFVFLVKVTCRRTWVSSTDRMILTGEKQNTRRKSCPCVRPKVCST